MGYDMWRVRERTDAQGDDDYFRLNVWGMGDAREQLASLAVIAIVESPPFPRSGNNLPDDFDSDNPRDEVERAHVEAVKAWTRSSIDGPGIPVFKLCSNDGWHVLPLEISSGIAAADANWAEWRTALHEFVLEFVQWMEDSPEGFVVW